MTDGELAASRVFATVDGGSVDGTRLDASGSVWVAAGPAIHCFHPDRRLIGVLRTPETCSNFAFGGPNGPALHPRDDLALLSAAQRQWRRPARAESVAPR